MKKRFFWALLALLLVVMLPQKAVASGNDYLEKEYHYMCYSMGMDKIHFKIPMWSKAGWMMEHTYFVVATSSIRYKTLDDSQWTTMANIVSYGTKGWDDSDTKGDIAMKLRSGEGGVVITSMANGVNYVVNRHDQWTSWLTVVRRQEAESDAVTWLEFDWFPPQKLDNREFIIEFNIDIAPIAHVFSEEATDPGFTSTWGHDYEVNPQYGPFTGHSNLSTPQLYDPYLYQVSESGAAGYGYAAVPYMLYNEPLWYRTSLMGATDTVAMTDEDRAGNLYVMTSDTVQENFHVTFRVWRNKDTKEYVDIQSTNRDIPPYHRIYDFMAMEEKDSTGTFTGNNILTWRIKNPRLRDIIDGDYFVLERATDSLFSDVAQLAVKPMVRDSSGLYEYVDDSRSIWSGNIAEPDTVNTPITRKVNNYEVRDVNGDVVYVVDLTLQSDKMVLPSKPVYYRLSRASANVWGKDSEFVHKAGMTKNNYLAPLAEVQEPYTKDVRYDENHRVHFRVRLDNTEVTPMLASEDMFELSFEKKQNLSETVSLYVDYTNTWNLNTAKITIINPNGHEQMKEAPLMNPLNVNVPRGSQVTIQYLFTQSTKYGDNWQSYTFDAEDDAQVTLEKWGSTNGYVRSVSIHPYTPAAGGVRNFLTEAKLAQLKDSIYQVFKQEYESSTVYGRCMWDKTARLVLIRTNAETGSSIEMIVPQDSIRRQADGSWLASFSDVADKACTHYSYAVRIDQSRSDLRVLHPETQLLPMTLNGPDLYFDEGAEIAAFNASQGDVRTELKRGVLLSWIPTNHSVDEYVLQRKELNSDKADTTLYTGLETSFFDQDAAPSVHYEYTITANFNCNGKGTSNSTTAEGWRTPYGEISGTIVLLDNSGMNGVQVALQKDGSTIRTMTTDASGSYRFDSLEYDATSRTDYTIVPTHPYATFSFNGQTAAFTTIGLSKNNAVASGINFMNMSCARLSGRLLYKNTTVPVSGAMFLLNGDTIMRNGAPLQSGIDGNFEIIVPKHQPNKLQVFKTGHVFEGDGILRVENNEETFALDRALDGVRFYDLTKVRLVGRVAGGNDQKDRPEAFGLGKNNLGEDLQLVLQLEGDNTAHLVYDPNDLTRDTFMTCYEHIVYSTDVTSAEPERVVGKTNMVIEKKRIIIRPDSATGEFEVDLIPVRYKVIQATAKGYATLFAAGTGNEVFDLTNAPLSEYSAVYDAASNRVLMSNGRVYENVPYNGNIHHGDSVHYNAVYDRIYHNPVQVEIVQNIYGMERPGFGEPEMETSDLDPNNVVRIPLYTKNADKSVTYTLGYPVFHANRRYQFKAKAYELYRYNNAESGVIDTVPQRGGSVIVRNGLHDSDNMATYQLNREGVNSAIWLEVDNVDVEHTGTMPLRNVTVALESEGNIVETTVFSAYVVGTVVEEKTLQATEADIQLLDIIRDPGGAGSSAWIESGASYTFSYVTSTKFEGGVNLTPSYGKNIEQYIGIVEAPEGTGTYLGQLIQTQKKYSFDIPLSMKFDYGDSYTYSLTTNERIATSTSQSPSGVGAPADVFFGTTVAMLTGKAKTISIISDSLYEASLPARNAGTMLPLAHGTAPDGKSYHLVTGTKLVAGSSLNNTFAYTQKHIVTTLIPKLAMERQSLMMHFVDSAQAQNLADALGEPVYWYFDSVAYLQDTIALNSYKMITPNDGKVYVDEVSALNKAITQWLGIVIANEEDKVRARMNGGRIGTYSTSANTNYQHSETYNSSFSYNEYPTYDAVVKMGKGVGTGTAAGMFKALATRFVDMLGSSDDKLFTFSSTAMDAMHKYFYDYNIMWDVADPEDGLDNLVGEGKWVQRKIDEVATQAGNASFSFSLTPIFNYTVDKRLTTAAAQSKTQGFNLVADPYGEITVSVYRAEYDSLWDAQTEGVLEQVRQSNSPYLRYGSYVYYTEGGATMCPHEAAEKTYFYNAGTPISNGTEWVAKPELTADTYEITNVAPDKRATARIHLYNQGQVDAGGATDGYGFYLTLDASSNPDGAKVYVNGTPIQNTPYYWIMPGTPVTQTIEIERGTADDYNLRFLMYVEGCIKTSTSMNLGVHFLPLSTDVEVAMPSQNWVMNTLSPQDSIGYYLPVSIDGFDIHHKNFDHIEFQYKLATQSGDDWVNQCSFYASDSLYERATGNKAMIENGRIMPFRFYGERDPMEQRYDLRAVSFCRYGSGFVTKTSPVISGTKDTRPPRVFGQPEPANFILGVGDNLKLRFNEPIAGNYLDEDNNFQILGVTNAMGLTATTALHFDAANGSKAETKVTRTILGKSFTIDMMIRPAGTGERELFSTYAESAHAGIDISLTADNRIKIQPHFTLSNFSPIYSKPLGEIKDYQRILVVWDSENEEFRTYAGTVDVTDRSNDNYRCKWPVSSSVATLIFGDGYTGDMLEARVWTKALTLGEISSTGNHYLTGYERELAAYYRMNEGRGDIVRDYANGASLYLSGCNWNKYKGYSLKLTKNQTVQLDGNLLGRSAEYDATYMLWFLTTDNSAERANIFSAGRIDNKHGVVIGLENGTLVLVSDSLTWHSSGNLADGEWHHIVLTINRTFNNASVFVDGNMLQSFPATYATGVLGEMLLGGNFSGNIDELAVFEQALPKPLIEAYDNIALYGDEMGLVGYLPFEEQKLNDNGVLEQVFSINDRRIYRDPLTLKEIKKEVPLVVDISVEGGILGTSEVADPTQNAPVADHGQLTKMNFDWAFNGDELLINLNMLDREVNKQSVYVTVRDVEDLNGNPMVSPVTWVAFVDRNSLKWEDDDMDIYHISGQEDMYNFTTFQIVNQSGKHHQYRIESLPSWLTVDKPTGTIDPLQDKAIRFYYDIDMPVGKYMDIVYLTDEDGLSEPLEVEYTVEAIPPYEDVDINRYPYNMSVCGQVILSTKDRSTMYDSDEDDIVYALFRNECVGRANVAFDPVTNTSELYLTIHGSDAMKGKKLNYVLWQASTGKSIRLNTDVDIAFSPGEVFGCGADKPVLFTTSGSEEQAVELASGWNWVSFNLLLNESTGSLSKAISANKPWAEGDIIKNPASQSFVTYSNTLDAFLGSFSYLQYTQTYMIYTKNGNTMHVNGDMLADDEKVVTLRGNGVWSPLPCLLTQTITLTEALADYYTYAMPGDLIKAQNCFAVFSSDKHWVGDLHALRPGEGYLFRRLGDGDVTIHFYEQTGNRAARRINNQRANDKMVNRSASTNMTMIAKLSNDPINDKMVKCYVGDELVGVAEPIDSLYFITICSDALGSPVEFRTGDGQLLDVQINDQIVNGQMVYESDSHYGSLKAPIVLKPGEPDRVRKVIEDDRVVIIRGGERYDVTGKRLNQ